MSRRWRAVIGLLGLAGLAVAALTTMDDVREQALPSGPKLGLSFVLQFVGGYLIARAWIALFPPQVDRAALARGMYTSQLTKYLPAGGIVQAASQVALSSQDGVASAALRLPIFSVCAVVAAATVGSGLALDGDLPGWARVLALLGLASTAALDRRLIHAVLRMARRLVSRIPRDAVLPPQSSILRCYAAMVVNMVGYSLAFGVLLGDLADVRLWVAAVAWAAAWGIGYLVIPVPSGLGVREAVLIAALPGVGTGPLLAASVAQRLLAFVSEAALAGTAHWRGLIARRVANADQGSRAQAAEPRSPNAASTAQDLHLTDQVPTRASKVTNP